MGPLLFILFFNDITDVIEGARIIKYADDTVIYAADKDIKVINTKLSKNIDSIADWFDENGLIINLKKARRNLFFLGRRKGLRNGVRHLM